MTQTKEQQWAKEPKWTPANSIAATEVMKEHGLTESDLGILVMKGYVRLRLVERELNVPTEDLANIPVQKITATDPDGPFFR